MLLSFFVAAVNLTLNKYNKPQAWGVTELKAYVEQNSMQQ